MLRLSQYILGLVLWLAFVFNIERLHIEKAEVIDIAGAVYALTVGIVVFAILLPQYQKISLPSMLILVLGAFVAVKLLDRRPFWGRGYTYVTLFEALSALITAALAFQVGRLTQEFIETARRILLVDLQDRVLTPEQAGPLIRREMQYSRRNNRALTVLLVEPGSEQPAGKITAAAAEIQRLLMKRYQMVALTRLLTGFIRSTDIVLDESDRGRIVLVTPKVNHEQAALLMRRLGKQAEGELGVNLRWSAATFPEQGLTFEELVSQAELTLKPDAEHRRLDSIATLDLPASDESLRVTNASSGATGS